jgi:membrane protease YdiL (CAAX protease family)
MASRNLAAIGIGILPINLVMIWYRLTQSENFSTADMIMYPLIFGGGSIILILGLNRYLLKQDFRSTFNDGKGNITNDALVGLGLTIIYFTLFFIERFTLMHWLPSSGPPNTELIDTIIDMSHNPVVMALWFGPVLWIGIALFEELSRVFLLKCLWNISNDKYWQVSVIILTSMLIGTVHLYQGVAGIISIGLKSVIVCFYYYKYRRLLPLIISHGLYDGLQFAYFIMQFR